MAFYRCVPSKKSDLPSGYTRVKYLESMQNAIEIAITSNGFYADVDFTPVEIPAGHGVIFGYYDLESTYSKYLVLTVQTGSNAGYRHIDTTVDLGFKIVVGDRHLVRVCDNQTSASIFVDGTKSKTLSTAFWRHFFSKKLCLFAAYYTRNSYRAALHAKIKLYGAVFYTDSTFEQKIHDFVPCLDVNGKPCMYDTVGKQPYYNATTLSGSNEFGYETMDGTYVAPV